eukprot:m.43511 g.43511  ORF g.43511 m.43511 type:complete len:388 (+) comp33450_c0_seq2:29-1192(+)
MDETANTSTIVNAILYPVFQVTCFLSMLGAASIIGTYVAFRELRSTSRQLLVFLSAMDFVTALANSYALFNNFTNTTTPCQVQAGVAIFSSLSSFFWTIFMAIFLFLTIVFERQTLARRLVIVFHLLAWGIPATVTITAAALDVLGLDVKSLRAHHQRSLVVTGGWCYVKGACLGSDNGCSPRWYDRRYFELWVLLAGAAWEIATFFLCLIFYLGIKVYIYKESRKPAETFLTRGLFTAATSVDRKLLFIPLTFLLLHVWSIIRDIVSFWQLISLEGQIWLIALEGIGDCGQGAANAIMFCLFTEVVRTKLKKSITGCFSCCRDGDKSSTKTTTRPAKLEDSEDDGWTYDKIKKVKENLLSCEGRPAAEADEMEVSDGSSLLSDMAS